MNTFNNIGKRFLTSAFLAMAAGLGTPVTLAGTEPLSMKASSDSPHLQLAYSTQRWPVYRNVHRKEEPMQVYFARFEERSGMDTGKQAPKGKPVDRHRRSPNHKAWR